MQKICQFVFKGNRVIDQGLYGKSCMETDTSCPIMYIREGLSHLIKSHEACSKRRVSYKIGENRSMETSVHIFIYKTGEERNVIEIFS